MDDDVSKAESTAKHYHHINIMTAGSVKSVQLLCEKSVLQLKSLSPPGPDREKELDQVQNIIVQIQRALNLNEEDARAIHKALSFVWDALQTRKPELLPKCLDIMAHFQNTLYMLQSKGV